MVLDIEDNVNFRCFGNGVDMRNKIHSLYSIIKTAKQQIQYTAPPNKICSVPPQILSLTVGGEYRMVQDIRALDSHNTRRAGSPTHLIAGCKKQSRTIQTVSEASCNKTAKPKTTNASSGNIQKNNYPKGKATNHFQ